MRSLHLAAVALGSSLACTGFGASGPFSGDGGLELVLEGSSETADVDAPVLAARFEDVGVDATAEVLAPNQVELKLQGIDVSLDRSALLARSVVEIRFPNGEVLSNDAIADAEAATSEYNQMPLVQLTLTDSGGKQFCTLSGQSVGEVVAIHLDGQVLSEPIVQEAICGGRIQITMGGPETFEHLMHEANGLASALRTDPLASEWTLLEERLFTR